MISAFDRRSSGARIRSGRPSTPARVASAASALERLEVLRTAVRVAGVVERVDAEDDRLRADHFRPASASERKIVLRAGT